MKISIIIPVYNEQKTVKHVIESVYKSGCENRLDLEVIIVDDFSTDNTRPILKKLQPVYGFNLIFQEKNGGKGTCIRKGISAATGDIVIIQDADLEYNPNEYPSLITPILKGDADVVYGSRFMSGPRRVLYFWHMLGNKFLTFCSNIVTNLNLTDMETCYKVFKKEIIQNIYLQANRFDFEPEITVKLAKMKARIYEVPISYRGRTYEEGKKISWKDAIAALCALIRYSLIDDKGGKNLAYSTLMKMKKLKRYNKWIYDKIEKYLGKTVLEIGSGIGNITRFLADKEKVIASDINQKYLLYLKNIFENNPNISIKYYDLSQNPGDELKKEKIDTIVCLNVLEHIKDDKNALQNLKSTLSDGGKLILLVPALKRLYGTLDKNLDHVRRYDKKELTDIMESSGFRIIHSEHINFVGAIGWYINSVIFKRKALPSNQIKFIDLLVGILKLEKYFKPKIGMSLIVVGEKN